jgi:hypothetical protein
MSHIFISYSTKNGDYARKLAEKLREEGFDVWIDKRRLHSSEDWWRSIVLALRGASVCVVILSPESDASRWVQREITLAEKYEKPMFPLLLEGDLDSPNWELFVRTQVENVTDGELPPAEFYNYLEQYTPRQQRPGADVTAAPDSTPVLDSETQAEIAHPPPSDVEDIPAEPIAVPVVHQEVPIPPLDVVDTPAEPIALPVEQPKPKRRFRARLAVALIGVAVLGVIGIGLWILPYRPAPVCPSGSSGQIAFDGRASGSGTLEIYVVNTDGSNLDLRTLNADSDVSPAWSPDGGQIAFSSDRSGSFKIYVEDAVGGNLRRLTQDSNDEFSPAWSPDGGQIAFRDGDYSISVMDTDGSNVRRLTDIGTHNDEPAWSPDGSQITFSSRRDGNDEIYVMNADGSNLRRLTQDLFRDVSPAWSPDGSQIAFESSRDGDEAIYVMNADGSNPLKLTPNNNDESPAWSPDGSQIAFESSRNAKSEIYVMNADGSNVCRVTDTGNNGAHAPAWRPA